jgi:hypothetical protein
LTGLNISDTSTTVSTSTTGSTTQLTLPEDVKFTGGSSGDGLTATGSYNVQTLNVNELRDIDIMRAENGSFR